MEALALAVPEILVPNKEVDPAKWAVVACDQFTSEPEYWEDVSKQVGEAPSTLNLIYPEAYLDEANDEKYCNRVKESSEKYLVDGVMAPFKGFVLVERKTPHIASRKGLMVALDLEKYDYKKGSQSLIRATEKTIEDRLPPRIRIRRRVPVELPHIMVLIDDPERTVIEPLYEARDKKETLYNFDMMKESGHLTGWKIGDEADIDHVKNALAKLGTKEAFNARYPETVGQDHLEVLLYAMGDGNHSLATAKSCWETLKKDGAAMDHPQRWALVELGNIHDEGNQFEPIHRLLFDCQVDDLLAKYQAYCEKNSMEFAFHEGKTLTDFPNGKRHVQQLMSSAKNGVVEVKNSNFVLSVATLTDFLDGYLKESKARVDYVHGTEVMEKHTNTNETAVGFVVPKMGKEDLFKTVIFDGALPRKTFSMGHAVDKRFYFECRKIVP